MLALQQKKKITAVTYLVLLFPLKYVLNYTGKYISIFMLPVLT